MYNEVKSRKIHESCQVMQLSGAWGGEVHSEPKEKA